MTVQPEPRLNRSATPTEMRQALGRGWFVLDDVLNDGVLHELYSAANEFFSAPFDDRMECVVPGVRGQVGYVPADVETPELSPIPDLKELYHVVRALPDDHPLKLRYPLRYPSHPDRVTAADVLRCRMLEFEESANEIAVDIARMIDSAFVDGHDFVAEMISHGPHCVRVAKYPSPAPEELDRIWAVDHCDFSLFTLLPASTGAGLEVLDGVYGWRSVDVNPAAVVVLVGMALEHMLGDLAPAARHRVRSRGTTDTRTSVVYFIHAEPWVLLQRLPGAPGPIRPVISADDLFERTMYRIRRV